MVLPVRAIGAPSEAGPPPPPPPPRPPRRTRLAASVISAPRQLDDYFEGSLYRRALWTCIAFAAGVRTASGSGCRHKVNMYHSAHVAMLAIVAAATCTKLAKCQNSGQNAAH
jgi:hypothetical protein